jgi:hypothetical protein
MQTVLGRLMCFMALVSELALSCPSDSKQKMLIIQYAANNASEGMQSYFYINQ